MVNREIPFRPKLEGEFRVRFYQAVSDIRTGMSVIHIEDIIKKEIVWVEDECVFNLEQRKKYRAVWMLFRDLVRASWRATYRDGILFMSLPSLNVSDLSDNSSPEVKSLLRSWMQDSRHERLVTYSDFIYRMEHPIVGKASIASLIADGDELADRLEKAHQGKIDISRAVKPYLQLVQENERDSFTGLKLSEIWRYCRLTWSTPAETTPGRTMQYLIRDAAHPMHAIMGIASLENCSVQITCRDDYIGWNQKAYIDRIIGLSSEEALNEFRMLLSYLEDGISGIDWHGLCSAETIINPVEDEIQTLLNIAASAEQERQELLRSSGDISEEDKSELGSISMSTERALYRRKRAEQLARLLMSKKAILALVNSPGFYDEWVDFCNSELGNSSIRSALVAQKTKHIGSSMMELNVCGAIPPYNEILGGKLVALLATSPQVIHDYKLRYANKSSEIASRLKGEPVCRPADLVYVGTTSLYYVGSSQYNRLKLPKEVFNSGFDVEWKRLGMTIGFGTMHISKATTMSLTEATSNGFTRINHVFGEGANPKMRLLTMSIRELLESTNEDSKDFSKHAMSRIVYGACLACNTSDYLLGKDKQPKYYTDVEKYEAGTQTIIDFWRNRWLASRLNYEPIYERIKKFDKGAFLVSTELETSEKWEFKKLKEVHNMPVDTSNQTGLRFIRDFYRGSSAYADFIDKDLLVNVHVKTQLDAVILKSVVAGKDIVLTGNPGDGKTHIIRMLKDSLEGLGKTVSIEMDASTLSNEELYRHWADARASGTQYIIAINAAVLYSLNRFCGEEFKPVRNAYEQMIHSVVFHGETVDYSDIVVYDLSKREVLLPDILKSSIEKLTADEHYQECAQCPFADNCDVHKHRALMNNELFQQRLFAMLQRVSLKGYHATLRELQSFISYLIFGNRSCKQLSKTTGSNVYDVVSLIYSGQGNLFKAVQAALDPTKISHPLWDEAILSNAIPHEGWVEGYTVPAEMIAYDNEELFALRKRQFYFFNNHGEELLNIIDDDAARFQEFLALEDKKLIKELIKKLNGFFGSAKPSYKELQIWTGHRYNNDPRKVLISIGSLKASNFSIGRPTFIESMKQGIQMTSNYVRFEREDRPGIFLKIDFDMYKLLNESDRGVPVLFTESDLVKQVWRFIEQLQSTDDVDDNEVTITLLDVQNKREISVSVDREDNRYTAIKSTKKN